MTVEEIREHFPHTRTGIYLNHAGSGPLSTPVVEAIDAYVEQRHRSMVENWTLLEPQVEETREAAAKLIGATPGEIEFVQNTSEGLSILVNGIDWQPGDRVAVPACEFPANVYPFLDLERKGVVVDWIEHDEGRITTEAVAAALRPETRLLTISWVQFLGGFRADLEAIGSLCQRNGTLFCVDAIQGLGALRLDVREAQIDFLSTGTQKWLMGTRGFGFVYVSRKRQAEIRPRAGWLHGPVDWDDFFNYELRFYPDARRYRMGTMNMIGMVALRAALHFSEAIGPERIERLILDNANHLATRLDAAGLAPFGRSSGATLESGIVTYRVSGAHDVAERLQNEGITTSVRNGMIRLAPSFYHTKDELDRACTAIERAVREGVPTK